MCLLPVFAWCGFGVEKIGGPFQIVLPSVINLLLLDILETREVEMFLDKIKRRLYACVLPALQSQPRRLELRPAS